MKAGSVVALLLLPSSALAATTAKPSSHEFAKAIEAAAHRPVRDEDIRIGSCRGPDEEPTEFECSWKQRIGGRWKQRTTWFAIDGKGWHAIDWPPTQD
jgi:hypothetical protein